MQKADPEKRWQSGDCLRHRMFTEIRDQKYEKTAPIRLNLEVDSHKFSFYRLETLQKEEKTQ